MSRYDEGRLVQALYARGLSRAEIADLTGFSLRKVSSLRNDPDGSKQKARRERYRHPCADCGALTDGSGGYKRQRRYCHKCQVRRQHEERYWTRSRILAAYVLFRTYYKRPPNARDWNHHHDSTPHGRPWPGNEAVRREFGGWGELRLAAGDQPNPKDRYHGRSRR